MVDREGRAAAHTGAGCVAHAGHRTGPGWTVQANMMLNADRARRDGRGVHRHRRRLPRPAAAPRSTPRRPRAATSAGNRRPRSLVSSRPNPGMRTRCCASRWKTTTVRSTSCGDWSTLHRALQGALDRADARAERRLRRGHPRDRPRVRARARRTPRSRFWHAGMLHDVRRPAGPPRARRVPRGPSRLARVRPPPRRRRRSSPTPPRSKPSPPTPIEAFEMRL